MCDPRVSSDLSWDKGHGICQAKLANNSCCRGKEEIKKRVSKKTFLLLQPVNLTVVRMRRIPTGEDGYINNTFLISIWIWFSCAPTGQSFQKNHTISHGDGQHRNVCSCIQLVKSSCPGGSALQNPSAEMCCGRALGHMLECLLGGGGPHLSKQYCSSSRENHVGSILY